MKTLLALFLLTALAFAGVQLPGNSSGGLHNEQGQLTGGFYVPVTTLVTWPYPDTGGQTEWTWDPDDECYRNQNGDSLYFWVIGWGPDWKPFAWHFEYWIDNPSPPGGQRKIGEGDAY